jgi:hypothetical protein
MHFFLVKPIYDLTSIHQIAIYLISINLHEIYY